jgi:hypothetical protein
MQAKVYDSGICLEDVTEQDCEKLERLGSLVCGALGKNYLTLRNFRGAINVYPKEGEAVQLSFEGKGF